MKKGKKILFLIVIMLILSAFPAMAQNIKEPVFFLAPLADISFYDGKKAAAGGGFIIGSDGKIAMGLSGIYFHELSRSETAEAKRILAMEITVFVRVYLGNLCLGPFFQFNGGPLILFAEDNKSIPAISGTSSVGLTFGWRLPLDHLLYIEPSIRGGYPFIFGGGLALGFRL